MSHVEPPDPQTGAAGASARREHERRRSRREQAVRDRHPRTAGLRLALAGDPTHEAAWARGAEGEERVAALLAKHVGAGVVVLHDRRIPGSRANIDHVAVAPSGVWVVDTKRYKGRATVSKPLFGTAKLTIGGRDRSRLVDGLDRQVELVRRSLAASAPDVAVHGALCFVDTEPPLLGTLTFSGYPLLRPRRSRSARTRAGPRRRARTSARRRRR